MSESTLKPFHESILGALEEVNSPKVMIALGSLIKETKIPKGHDAVISAWVMAMQRNDVTEDHDVMESITKQKAVAEAKSKSRGGGELD